MLSTPGTEELYFVSREAISTVVRRREEFLSVVEIAGRGLARARGRRAQNEAHAYLWSKLRAYFELEEVRVHVDVMGDDAHLGSDEERQRGTDVDQLLFGMVWSYRQEAEDDHDEESPDGANLQWPDGTLGDYWLVSLRRDELDMFAAAVHAKHLFMLLHAAFCEAGTDGSVEAERILNSCREMWLSRRTELLGTDV